MDLDKEFHNNPYAMATFLIDGFKVHVHNALMKNRLEKLIYVNGQVKGEWYVNKESEERKRFGYATLKFAHGMRFRKAMKDLNRLRKIKKDTSIDAKIEVVTFSTTASFKVLLKQWKEREINKSIELVDSDGIVLHKYK